MKEAIDDCWRKFTNRTVRRTIKRLRKVCLTVKLKNGDYVK